MKLIKEFRDFAMRGNVVDLAVGVIIGGAFGKIVSSLTNDLLMPPLGLVLGGVDFSSLKLTIKAAEGDAAAVTLNYGVFVNTILDFVIIAFCVFMIIKVMNRLKKKEEAAPVAPPAEVVLLTDIRDLLKKRA